MNPADLPAMLALIDDDDPAVREQVIEVLVGWGDALDTEIAERGYTLTGEQREGLGEVRARRAATRLRQTWAAWLEVADDSDRLEKALGLIGDYQLGYAYPLTLGMLLDELADEYRATHETPDVFSLSQFLFTTKGFHGNSDDFHSPQNSNLVSVILSRKGIPISLVCIYMLVGNRLGLDIRGCSLPGFFLARVIANGRMVLVDCFNGGRFMEVKNVVAQTRPGMSGQLRVLRKGTSVRAIVRRFLTNLIAAYRRADDRRNTALMEELRELVSDA